MNLQSADKASNLAEPRLESVLGEERTLLDAEAFRRMIALERKRTERSKAPFVLVLLESANQHDPERNRPALYCIISALLSSSRDTDVVGWYAEGTTVGALFTGLEVNEKNSILSTIMSRVRAMLRKGLTLDEFNQVSISLHLFPDNWDDDGSGRPCNPALYPDLLNRDPARRSLLIMKRAVDIAGSALMTVLCGPLCLIIALAIKATSEGPVLFKQQRVGQYGQTFTFLKFRSMYVGNDDGIHKEYVMNLITRQPGCESSNGNEGKVYKLTNDKRVTRVGKFLRKYSLDELPQFLNVLIGDMSLVGPRPPIPYELATYQTWHRSRLLEVKPGITGLWQVTGRSRVDFNEMVRLDLRYASSWTPWLDVKILLRTPLVVLKGTGAY